MGGLLWLVTRTRPDLAFAVSSTAQVLTRDMELLKVKLRHLLQDLNTTKTMGLLYAYPRKPHLPDLTVFTDSLPRLVGTLNQDGNARRLTHWQSLREQKNTVESRRIPRVQPRANCMLWLLLENRLGTDF